MMCINAMPRIMLLASHRKVTSGNPTVLRVPTMCVGGYPTFAARGPSPLKRKVCTEGTAPQGCGKIDSLKGTGFSPYINYNYAR
jgi:hypothetical protein